MTSAREDSLIPATERSTPAQDSPEKAQREAREEKFQAIYSIHRCISNMKRAELRSPSPNLRWPRARKASLRLLMSYVISLFGELTHPSNLVQEKEMQDFLQSIRDVQELYFFKSVMELPQNELIERILTETDVDEIIVRKLLKLMHDRVQNGSFTEYTSQEAADLISKYNTSEDNLSLGGIDNLSSSQPAFEFAISQSRDTDSDRQADLSTLSEGLSTRSNRSKMTLDPGIAPPIDKYISKKLALSHDMKTPSYRIENIPGKGRGLVADRKIHKGERILAETPLFKFPPDSSAFPVERTVPEQVERLDHDALTTFFNLKNSFPGKGRDVGIAMTVGLGLGPGESFEEPWGIFPTFALLNNDCKPNGWAVWNPALNKYTLHAQRDIEEGEEITMYYSQDLSFYELRQTDMMRHAQFHCICQRCALTEDERDENDIAIIKLMTILKSVKLVFETNAHLRKGAELLSKLHYALEIIDEVGPAGFELLKVYEFAIAVARKCGDRARTHVFAMMRYRIVCELQGEDHPEAVEMLKLGKHPFGRFDARGWITFKSGPFRKKKYRPLSTASKSLFEEWLWYESFYTPFEWERKCYERRRKLA